MDLNKVTLIGRSTKDIEAKIIESTQSSVTNFNIATNRNYKNKDGNITEEVEFHKCVAYGKSAEVLATHVLKGSKIYLEGRLKTNQWKDKDGIEKSSTEIVVDHFIFLDAKNT